MKLKDKTAADIVATWYMRVDWLPGTPRGSLAALRNAMLALEGPDLPDELRAWQEAVQANQQVIANRVVGQYSAVFWRTEEAERALTAACAEGVAT
jgi:hypothetical protein